MWSIDSSLSWCWKCKTFSWWRISHSGDRRGLLEVKFFDLVSIIGRLYFPIAEWKDLVKMSNLERGLWFISTYFLQLYTRVIGKTSYFCYISWNRKIEQHFCITRLLPWNLLNVSNYLHLNSDDSRDSIYFISLFCYILLAYSNSLLIILA